jgi:hypothetical protein
MIPFLIAGGSVLTTLVAPEPPDSINHTLLGVKVKAKEVVTRNAWGTPMMPTDKGSYSLIAPPDPILIERSLIQPPKTDAPTYVPGKPYKIASQLLEEEKPAESDEAVPVVQGPAAPVEQVAIEEAEPTEEILPAEAAPSEAAAPAESGTPAE